VNKYSWFRVYITHSLLRDILFKLNWNYVIWDPFCFIYHSRYIKVCHSRLLILLHIWYPKYAVTFTRLERIGNHYSFKSICGNHITMSYPTKLKCRIRQNNNVGSDKIRSLVYDCVCWFCKHTIQTAVCS
jgi:hypothetical protein